jgi:excisionase family DNA binding protein
MTTSWLTSQRAADLIGVSLATIRRWADREEIHWRTPGGQRRFDRGQLEQWLAERQR